MEKISEVSTEEEGLCPSMYSFHSSPEEKNKLLFTLTQYGIETTVDRCAKKDRIRQWIQASVIEEENEEDEHTEEGIGIRDNQTGPPGERVENRGPVQDARLKNKERRLSTISLRKINNDEYVPPIDPRIPLEKQMTRRRSSIAVKNGSLPNGNSIPNGKINHRVVGESPKPNSVQASLPFQTVTIRHSQESVGGQNNAIKHKINVQIPQNELYNCSLSPKLPPRADKAKPVLNGKHVNGNRDSPVNKRPSVANGSRRNTSSISGGT